MRIFKLKADATFEVGDGDNPFLVVAQHFSNCSAGDPGVVAHGAISLEPVVEVAVSEPPQNPEPEPVDPEKLEVQKLHEKLFFMSQEERTEHLSDALKEVIFKYKEAGLVRSFIFAWMEQNLQGRGTHCHTFSSSSA